MTAFEKRIIAFCLLGSVFAAWAWISELDYQDALISEQHTCAMVRDGIWPAEQAENYNCAEPAQVAGVDHE